MGSDDWADRCDRCGESADRLYSIDCIDPAVDSVCRGCTTDAELSGTRY